MEKGVNLLKSENKSQLPVLSPIDEITKLLVQGQVNDAIQKAILNTDPFLIQYALKTANYKTVFHNLQQPVIIMLIEYISGDMSLHNELKHQYLMGCVVNVEWNLVDINIRKRVIGDLMMNCKKYILENPKQELTMSVKLLLMAAENLNINSI